MRWAGGRGLGSKRRQLLGFWGVLFAVGQGAEYHRVSDRQGKDAGGCALTIEAGENEDYGSKGSSQIVLIISCLHWRSLYASLF